jgi:hypothetical protein
MEIPEVRHGMKSKTIKAILTKKINQWAETIEDETVRKLVQKGTVVTGGCIASMLLGEEVNDFDIYLRDHTTALAVANYYVDRFKQKSREGIETPLTVLDEGGRIKIVAKSTGILSADEAPPYQYFEGGPDEQGTEYVSAIMTNPDEIADVHEDTEIQSLAVPEERQYRPVFLSSNAITLSDKIQIVLRFYGEPDAIHENYDFSHCTSYWTSWDGKLVLRPEALESLLSKELRYVGSKYPVCSVVRLRKFIARGWRINAGQVLKMAMQISALDLTDVKTLEDQLTGVDTAYFVQLIARMKERDPDKINTAYLVEIIDRLF